MKQHKHAELIKAWADGAEIQMKFLSKDWEEFDDVWTENEHYDFRIKPKLTMQFRYFALESHPLLGLRFSQCAITDCKPDTQYIKVTLDAETTKILSMEIL